MDIFGFLVLRVGKSLVEVNGELQSIQVFQKMKMEIALKVFVQIVKRSGKQQAF